MHISIGAHQRFFKAGPPPIELVSILPVHDYPTPSHPTPERIRVANLYLPDIQPGDWVSASFMGEVTNPLTYNVELAQRMIFSRVEEGLVGYDLAHEIVYNISPNMHHGEIVLYADWRVPDFYAQGNGWLAVLLYAGGGSTTQSGDYAVLERGYGSFSAKVSRGVQS